VIQTKIRVISSREEIPTISPTERIAHITFRPSNTDFFQLVNACPKIEVIQLPKTNRKTVSKSIELFLKMNRIELVEGDVWGHRKDLNEYYNIPSGIMEKISSMKELGKNNDEIIVTVSADKKINADLVAYILNRN